MRRAPAGLLVATVALVTAGCHRAPEEEADTPAPITTRCVPIERASIDETIALRGRLTPPPGGDLPVASQVAGRVVDVAVHEGQHVAKGDLVASVDDVPSRDALRQAEASLAQAEAAEVNARATLDRAKALVARGIAAKQEQDDAVAREDAARASVASAQAAADLARRTLGRVQVHSSFDGVVTRVWRGAGAIVDGTAATPIVQLAAGGALEVVAEVTDRDLARVREGQEARGEVSAFGAVSGKVRARSSSLDPATGLGVVRILVDHVDGSPPIGAFARVDVRVAHRDDVPLLPSAALRGAVADGAEVAICDHGKAAIRVVQIGHRDDARFEPTGGVGPGDRVAVDHVLGLSDGTPITEAP